MIMPKKELKSENSAGTALQEMESLSPGGDLQAYINSVHSIGILTSQEEKKLAEDLYYRNCLLYTSPSPRDKRQSRMPSSA